MDEVAAEDQGGVVLQEIAPDLVIAVDNETIQQYEDAYLDSEEVELIWTTLCQLLAKIILAVANLLRDRRMETKKW